MRTTFRRPARRPRARWRGRLGRGGPARRPPTIHLVWRETSPGIWQYVAVDDRGRPAWTP